MKTLNYWNTCVPLTAASPSLLLNLSQPLCKWNKRKGFPGCFFPQHETQASESEIAKVPGGDPAACGQRGVKLSPSLCFFSWMAAVVVLLPLLCSQLALLLAVAMRAHRLQRSGVGVERTGPSIFAVRPTSLGVSQLTQPPVPLPASVLW